MVDRYGNFPITRKKSFAVVNFKLANFHSSSAFVAIFMSVSLGYCFILRIIVLSNPGTHRNHIAWIASKLLSPSPVSMYSAFRGLSHVAILVPSRISI